MTSQKSISRTAPSVVAATSVVSSLLTVQTSGTGFTDLAIDPSNSNVLYAASYQRRRLGCCFNGGGPGSALWKTEDAGRTWTKLEGNGLPPGTYGRIALDVTRSNPNGVYAQIEAGQSNTVAVAGAAPTAAGRRPAAKVVHRRRRQRRQEHHRHSIPRAGASSARATGDGRGRT